MRMIDADELKNQVRHMPRTVNPDLVQYSLVQAIIGNMPTLTPPNEPLTCKGCIHEHKEHEYCNYCERAPYLGDYYYRRPPEGEEDT